MKCKGVEITRDSHGYYVAWLDYAGEYFRSYFVKVVKQAIIADKATAEVFTPERIKNLTQHTGAGKDERL